MSRGKWELFILAQEFPWYTKNVDEIIHKTARTHHCADTDDLVVDAVWRACPSELEELNEAASACSESEAKLAAEGQLTPGGREAIRAEIDKALTRKDDIEALSGSEIIDLYQNAATEDDDKFRAMKEAQGAESDCFAFFNEPRARANFAYWRSASIRTPEQSVALSFGKEPRVVNLESLGGLYSYVLQSPFRQQFRQRLDFIEQHLWKKQLSFPMIGSDFYLWAEQHNFPCTRELASPTERVVEQRAAQQVEDEDPEGHLRTGMKHKLYQIILGIVVSKYGYDPYLGVTTTKSGALRRQDQGTVFCTLHEDILNRGLKVDRKTITDHVHAAADWAQSKGLKITKPAETPTDA